MTDNKSIAAALEKRFFAPLRRPRTRRVGVELELPVWNLAPGKATDFAAVHDHPDFGLFSCASQVQIDADEETVVEVINAFNALKPFKAVLFANSPFGERGETIEQIAADYATWKEASGV